MVSFVIQIRIQESFRFKAQRVFPIGRVSSNCPYVHKNLGVLWYGAVHNLTVFCRSVLEMALEGVISKFP
uniref:Uncharacterized protein n=1 Tax=Salix viminalis TaxID=40686 RepID=A0A6N2M7T0_SALVM